MKNYIVPCFVVVQADSAERAFAEATKYKTMKNGSVLVMDEKLPTVETSLDLSKEYPHSMTKVPELSSHFKPHA